MQSTYSEPRRHRPLGVTIISVIVGIEGILEILAGVLILLVALAASHAISSHGHTTIAHVVDVVGVIVALIPIVLGVLRFILAAGLWALKRWAFWVTVIVEVITLVRQALEFTLASRPPVVLIILGMVIPVIVLLYFLVDSNVRAAFFGRG